MQGGEAILASQQISMMCSVGVVTVTPNQKMIMCSISYDYLAICELFLQKAMKLPVAIAQIH